MAADGSLRQTRDQRRRCGLLQEVTACKGASHAAEAYLKVAITGAWSLVPMSASTGQVAARAANGPEAIT